MSNDVKTPGTRVKFTHTDTDEPFTGTVEVFRYGNVYIKPDDGDVLQARTPDEVEVLEGE